MPNSFVVSTPSPRWSWPINSLTTYAFRRLEFPGRDFSFVLVLGPLRIPGDVTLIPFPRSSSCATWNGLIPLLCVDLARRQSGECSVFCCCVGSCSPFRRSWKMLPPDAASSSLIDAHSVSVSIRIDRAGHICLPRQLERYAMQGLSLAAALATLNSVMVIGPMGRREAGRIHVIEHPASLTRDSGMQADVSMQLPSRAVVIT